MIERTICKKEFSVDPMKTIVIVNLPPPTSLGQLHTTLGHTRYYMRFMCDHL